jgi:purine-nucleoside phosphorylase
MRGSPSAVEVLRQIGGVAAQIRARCPEPPCLGLILGSGLGSYAGAFLEKTVIPYRELPHFPMCGVPGHAGNLVLGKAEGVPAVALQGRVHLYEGYTMAEVAFPVRVLGLLGITHLIVTNAAGGVAPEFEPGELMLIRDHINLMGGNPLIGPNIDELGPRFPDMSETYDPGLRNAASRAAAELGIRLREGVYAGLSGPAYETPAEIRMCRTLGADAVGMSTVPEVIAARHMGIRVLGISCIANMAAGILPRRLSHAEVIATTHRVGESFVSLLRGTIPLLPGLTRSP